VLVVATKCDKLKRNELEQQRKLLAAQVTDRPPLLFSAETGLGKEELWQALLALVAS
jgi:GTP-binding protein EngB required for normal cell division